MKNQLKVILVLTTISTLISCQKDAQSIVDEAIEKHGGKAYNKTQIELDFRDKHYIIYKNEGKYRYERLQKDSSGIEIKDVLTNDSFARTRNNQAVSVPDSMVKKYSNSINSVVYFFLLPAPLNDPAVKKKLVGESTIKGQKYYKIEATFTKEGGGKDHDDEFLYWINQDTKTVDYFAYLYHTDEVGIRFREAINVQEQAGIRFADYNNYEPTDWKNTKLEDLDKLFEQGKLKLLSKIDNKNVIIKGI
jgi:hypothetical protein